MLRSRSSYRPAYRSSSPPKPSSESPSSSMGGLGPPSRAAAAAPLATPPATPLATPEASTRLAHHAQFPPGSSPADASRRPRSRSLERPSTPLRLRHVRASAVGREIEQAGAPEAYASATLRALAVTRLTDPAQCKGLSEAQVLQRVQAIRPRLERVLQWAEPEELQALWTMLCVPLEAAAVEGIHPGFQGLMQAQQLELVAAALYRERPLERDTEITRTFQQALPLLARAGKKEGLLEVLGMRMRALFCLTTEAEIAWRLETWEKLPDQESPAQLWLRALIIFSLRCAYRGEATARQELLHPPTFKRLDGNKTQVWSLQFHMVRLACAGIAQAEQTRMRRLCLERPVAGGLPPDELKLTLRLREFMLRGLQTQQPPTSSAQRLLAISSLTDLAASVNEPLRSQLLARGIELRSLLPLELVATAHSPARPQAEGKAAKG